MAISCIRKARWVVAWGRPSRAALLSQWHRRGMSISVAAPPMRSRPWASASKAGT